MDTWRYGHYATSKSLDPITHSNSGINAVQYRINNKTHIGASKHILQQRNN
jgi:hypothetical protein